MDVNGSEWQLALGLLCWMGVNGSEWQLALGLLSRLPAGLTTADRKIVVKAVRQDGRALDYASQKLQRIGRSA